MLPHAERRRSCVVRERRGCRSARAYPPASSRRVFPSNLSSSLRSAPPGTRTPPRHCLAASRPPCGARTWFPLPAPALTMEATTSTAGMPLPAGLGIPTLASTFALALTSLGDSGLRTAVARAGVPARRSRPTGPQGPFGFRKPEGTSGFLPIDGCRSQFGTVFAKTHWQALAGLSWLSSSRSAFLGGCPRVSDPGRNARAFPAPHASHVARAAFGPDPMDGISSLLTGHPLCIDASFALSAKPFPCRPASAGADHGLGRSMRLASRNAGFDACSAHRTGQANLLASGATGQFPRRVGTRILSAVGGRVLRTKLPVSMTPHERSLALADPTVVAGRWRRKEESSTAASRYAPNRSASSDLRNRRIAVTTSNMYRASA
jgi:hypothetical protein